MAALTLAACGGDDDPPAEDPEMHACEEASTAGSAITASAVRDDTAPVVEIAETPFMAELPDGAAGYVRLDIAGDTAALLFTQETGVLAGLFHEDAEETLGEGEPNELCPEDLPEHFDVDFHEAGTWYLELGPTGTNQAWFLLTTAEGHEH
jgi:hypothetical protein